MIRTRHACLLLATVAAPGLAQDAGVPGQRKPEFTMTGNINKPTMLPANLGGLHVPPGYSVSIAAQNLGNLRMIAVAGDGTVYVTRRDTADLMMLKDTDGDGLFETRAIVAARPNLHGIAIDGRTIYLVGTRFLFSAPLLPNGTLGALKTLADDLPDAGQHPNRTIALGPDGLLYISVGSTCNACPEPNQENATILTVNKQGKGRRIFASGLRNTIGFDWNPVGGQLWGLDQGIDWLGDEEQPEELNRIERGRRYGWPYIWGAGGRNPQDVPPNGLTHDDWDRISQRMVLGYAAHAAAMQLKFAGPSAFPADAKRDAFATFRGSWNRAEPKGYEVVRIRFDAAGNPTGFEPFLTGFLTTGPGGEAAWTGRPTGLAFAGDGAMLVGDSENGVLYRVRYTGPGATAPAAMAGMTPPPPVPNMVAFDRSETATTGKLVVTSSALVPGQPIPPRFSRYYDNVSPPLAWSGAPATTRSYAVIVDDPDSPSRPATHWLAWNIPAATTMLKEGIPGVVQLDEPKDGRQGSASSNMIGYTGPMPMVGDTPHHYNFQLFALDATLPLDPGANREALLQAMRGHVVAKGRLIGTFAQPAPPTKP